MLSSLSEDLISYLLAFVSPDANTQCSRHDSRMITDRPSISLKIPNMKKCFFNVSANVLSVAMVSKQIRRLALPLLYRDACIHIPEGSKEADSALSLWPVESKPFIRLVELSCILLPHSLIFVFSIF